MRYMQIIDDENMLTDCKKRLDSFGDGKTYLIVYDNNKLQSYRTSETPINIIIDGDECTPNDKAVISALKKGHLLGDAFDYTNSNVLTVKDCSSITSLGNMMNSNINNGQMSFSVFSGITDLSVLENMRSITDISGMSDGEYKNMFGMPNLRKVRLPNNIKEIGNSAFAFCLSLNDIIIPSSVKTICPRAFYNCLSLFSITIPSSVKLIDSMAFGTCRNLETVILKGSTPPTIVKDTFKNVSPNIKFIVPKRNLDNYKKAWQDYAERIVSK